MLMVLTVTLNPAIDKLLILQKFEVHKLHRLEKHEESLISSGGKGVNIALALNKLGNDVVASGFAGGHSGHLLCDGLRHAGITTNFTFTEGLTRTNTSILDKENETLTEINDFGQEIQQDDLEFFLDNYNRLIHRVNFVVIAGSVPLGLPENIYLQMVETAKEKNVKVLLHTSPNYMHAALSSSPFLVNPDMRSCHEFLGKSCDGIDQFIDVGRDILIKNKDTEFVIFTHRIENVVAITRIKTYILRPVDLKIVNMLGYADSYLAGFVHAYLQELSVPEILKYASACGLTNVEDLYKDIHDIGKITKNLSRIDVEEMA